MTDHGGAASPTDAGTCWFCRREVRWATLIAGYDTWDEQRLACPSCDRSVRWLREHGWNLSRAANEDDAQATFDRTKEMLAAQEAPAPEGLPWKPIALALLSTMKGIARDRTVTTIENARRVAEAAVANANAAAMRAEARPPEGLDTDTANAILRNSGIPLAKWLPNGKAAHLTAEDYAYLAARLSAGGAE